MIYFASDFHLGIPSWKSVSSKDRESRVFRWLSMISEDKDLKALYLVGDIFDFWFDYHRVVPKGFVRILGKLAELSDRGVELHLFTGNHDVWFFDYFEKELNARIHRNSIEITIADKNFFIAHGDGLGPGDYGYKFIKKIFRNPICQWLFRWLHPDIGVAIANFFSKTSRASQDTHKPFLGEDKEWLIIYANEKLKKCPHIDYFIFGHRHLAQDLVLRDGKSRYINLGHWFGEGNYAFFDGAELLLKKFE
jgi:UDP-2,3-diacylglucosamine hydrolase